MITFEWEFPSLFVVLKQGILTNIVTQIDWVLEASYENQKVAACSGTIALGPAAKENFIDFKTLKKETVEQWVLKALGDQTVNKLKADLTKQADEQINATSVSMSPPWLRRIA